MFNLHNNIMHKYTNTKQYNNIMLYCRIIMNMIEGLKYETLSKTSNIKYSGLVFTIKRQILRYSRFENSHPSADGLLDFQNFKSIVFDVFLSKAGKRMSFLAGTN